MISFQRKDLLNEKSFENESTNFMTYFESGDIIFFSLVYEPSFSTYATFFEKGKFLIP